MRIKDKAKPKVPAIEPGVYMAVCVGVIDLGEQYSEMFKNYRNEVQIVWEIPSETVEIDGETKPRQLSRTFSVATSRKANLRAIISSWNGKTYSDDEFGELDLFAQIGKPCMLNVVLNDSGEYSNVDSVVPMPKGVPAPVSTTPPIRWDMDAWDDAVFQTLPEWARDKIKKSTQYTKQHTPTDKIDFQDNGEPATAPQSESTVKKESCPI
mgnify:CR=1 FL=1